jgi:predicted ester cyclase
MAEPDNEQLARRFYEEFWTCGNADAADDRVAEDLVHEQFPEGWPRGREGSKRLVTTWRAAFRDMRERVSQVLSDGDWVVARFALRGTHLWIYCEDALGVFAQLGALPADLSGIAGPLHAA